jgi:two-component system, LytTR family, response regulator
MRALLVDDEPLALRGLALRLAPHADVEIVGTCENGREALAAVAALRPDVVFLDVQMPGLDGLAVVRALPGPPTPLVVFVTAYDRYALAAFAAHALDYLLKPLDPDRLADVLDRVRAHLHREQRLDQAERLRALLAAWEGPAPVQEAPAPPARFLVRTGARLVPVDEAEVRWIEAMGDYVRLHTRDGRAHLLRETMHALADRLDGRRFLRLHRSTIVAADALRELRTLGHGDVLAVLDDGTTRRVGRAYRAAVNAHIGRG